MKKLKITSGGHLRRRGILPPIGEARYWQRICNHCPQRNQCGWYYANGRSDDANWLDSDDNRLGNALRFKWWWRNGGSCNFNKREFKYKTPEEDQKARLYIYIEIHLTMITLERMQ